ncbi:MAG TPA: MFS transporter [Segeticoccus sp.]|uniref:MFS transporter n=1 Tax=Segeticoccus sp. TaxID=2706531 RepID=UPI002D8046EF|nr:MFS transporter [Segeticoccus sp.]HET8599710.1 MFS transporter [Segeticoccus sp.]
MNRSTGYRVGEPGYRRVTLGLFFAGLTTFALLYTTQPLLPELSDRFGVSAAQSALTVSLATLGLAVGLVVAGPLSDTRGRVSVMRISLVASSLIGVASALAPSWTLFLLLRALEGVALAGLPAVAMAYLREEVHGDRHPQAAGLYVGGTAIGGMAGRLVAGGLADLGGWRLAVGGVAVLGLVSALAAVRLLPASRGFTARPANARALLEATSRLLHAPAQLALYAIAATAMGAFVAAFNGIGFRLSAAPFSLSPAFTGLVFLVYVVGVVSSPWAGRQAAAHGRANVIVAGAVVTLAGLALTLAPWLPLVVLGLAVTTGGFFAMHGVASGWVPARAHIAGAAVAQASSLYLIAYYVGSSLFGDLAGVAWSTAAWPAVVGLSGVLIVVTLLLGLFLRHVPRARPVSEELPPLHG